MTVEEFVQVVVARLMGHQKQSGWEISYNPHRKSIRIDYRQAEIELCYGEEPLRARRLAGFDKWLEALDLVDGYAIEDET